MIKRKTKTVFAFGKIRDKVRYRLKFAHFPYLAKALLRQRANAPDGLRVLDVGCGPGNLGSFCGVPERSRWLGVDLWEHQLHQAAEKGVYEGLYQVNLVDGLPFRNECIDVVVCNEVLMYLPNAEKALEEFHRVLRPGGAVFIYNPISWMPGIISGARRWIRRIYQERKSIALDSQADWKSAQRPSRINYYSFGSLIEQVRSARFQVSEVTGFRLFRNRIRLMTRLENYRWYFRITRFITRRYPRLASDLMVTARKEDAAPSQSSAVTTRAAA